ncbi:hypothetical protein KY346_04900 [Candidatus Woesearchaeota archaeon]|nr:hypothetical protein [Candidatus Woesearchaeota archaeon]
MGIVEETYRAYLKSEEDNACVLEHNALTQICIEFNACAASRGDRQMSIETDAQNLYIGRAMHLFKLLNKNVVKSDEFYLTEVAFIRDRLQRQGLELVQKGHGGSLDKHDCFRLDEETLDELTFAESLEFGFPTFAGRSGLLPFIIRTGVDEYGEVPLALVRESYDEREGYSDSYWFGATITDGSREMFERIKSVEAVLEEWTGKPLRRVEDVVKEEEEVLWG